MEKYTLQVTECKYIAKTSMFIAAEGGNQAECCVNPCIWEGCVFINRVLVQG